MNLLYFHIGTQPAFCSDILRHFGGEEGLASMLIQISAGSGPVEVRRFVALLASRIVSLCDEQKIAIRARQEEGEEEAPRSISLWVVEPPRGLSAGTHQLISKSGSRSQASRKRWFAAVTIHQEEQREAALSHKDLAFSACRAGGPGGQNVNKVSSAVRAVHKPTGVSVKVSTERSQSANKRLALSRIEQRLQAINASQEAKRQAAQRDAHYQLIRGNPVASYQCVDGSLRLSTK